jgi:peptidyl-prolyl cis-trans isomerase SurA
MKGLLVALLTLAAVVLGAGPMSAQKSEIIQKIIVKVNGEIFTLSELEFRQSQVLKEQNRSVKTARDLTTDPALMAALADVTPTLLLEAVDELMLVQHGRELGVKFSDANFVKFLERIKEQNSIKDDAILMDALKQEGITMADLRVQAERTSIIEAVRQHELMKNMTLTDEEARQYYKANPDKFIKPATVTLREIFVAVPTTMVSGQATVSVGVEEEAKQKITATRERALKGEDFAKLVTEVSESGTKANAGLIGPIAAADLLPAISDMLAKMKPGDVSEPIRTRTGFQILKLETVSSPEPEPFDKSREVITRLILESRLDVEQAKFIDRLLLQAVIEWKDESYKKLYETARAARAKATAAAAAVKK